MSLVFHEVAHGYVAHRLGDPTAKSRGRLNLNPLKHLDPFGTLVLFLTFFGSGGSMLFGWAKPVPINPGYFKSPQKGMALVGAAGPLTNLLLAMASAFVLEDFLTTSSMAQTVVFTIFQLNVILMLFNLIPVPPLDGSRIIGAFLNRQTYIRWVRLDQYGMMFMMVVLFLMIGPFNTAFFDVLRGIYQVFLPSYTF